MPVRNEIPKRDRVAYAFVGTTIAILLLAVVGHMVPGLSQSAGCSDHADADVDMLTDCLELDLGTNPNDWDFDGDEIPDGLDLLRQVDDAAGIPVEIKIVSLYEGGTKCDVKGARYWDPYISTGFVTIPTIDNEEHRGHFDKTGFTLGKHNHDKRTLEPVSLVAALSIPQNVNAYDLENVLDMPRFSLRLGLYDHDTYPWGWEGNSNPIDLGIGTDGISLPIHLNAEDGVVEIPIEGTAECRGKLKVAIQTPLKLNDVIASIVARFAQGSGADGAASRADVTGGTGEWAAEFPEFGNSGSAMLDYELGYVNANVENVLTLIRDADYYANPAAVPDHQFWHVSGTPCYALSGMASMLAPKGYAGGNVTVRLLADNGEVSNHTFVPLDVSGFYLPSLDMCDEAGQPMNPNVLQLDFALSNGTVHALSYPFSEAPPASATDIERLVVINGTELVEGWSSGWLWSAL